MEDYKQFLKKAEDDLRWTGSNIKGKIWYGACFTSQQSVEKALKGFLLYHGKPLRKIHDLRALLEDCISINPEFEKIREYTIPLIAYYIKTRYPAYEEVDRFTKEQAEEAYEHAKQVFAFVREQLPR